MIERKNFLIKSKDNGEFAVQFLKHVVHTKHLVIIFPGGDNSTDIPTLHYARKAALLVGYDILSLKYSVPGHLLNLDDKCVLDTIVEECLSAIETVNYHVYKKIIFISKSIGNIIALEVDRVNFNSEINHVFYTPIESLVEKIVHKECLIFTGEEDKLIARESLEMLKKNNKVKITQFQRAVHSLEVNDSVEESLKILENVTRILSEFLEKEFKVY